MTQAGHGYADAISIQRIYADGTLTLADSFAYGRGVAPSVATHNSVGDLAFRFLPGSFQNPVTEVSALTLARHEDFSNEVDV